MYIYILLFKARTIYFYDISKFTLNSAAGYILLHTLALCEALAVTQWKHCYWRYLFMDDLAESPV